MSRVDAYVYKVGEVCCVVFGCCCWCWGGGSFQAAIRSFAPLSGGRGIEAGIVDDLSGQAVSEDIVVELLGFIELIHGKGDDDRVSRTVQRINSCPHNLEPNTTDDLKSSRRSTTMCPSLISSVNGCNCLALATGSREQLAQR